MAKYMMKFSGVIKNFFTSGLPEDFDLERKRKIVMINVISVIGVVNLIPLGFLAYVQHNVPLGFFDHVVAVVLIINFLYLRKSKNENFASYFGISFAFGLFLYLFATGGVKNTGHVWYYTFPLIASFLLGSKRGAIATLLLLIPAVVVLTAGNEIPELASYTKEFKMRFIPSFLVVFLYAYLFEKTREKTQESLTTQNDVLHKTLINLKAAQEKLQAHREDLERAVKERTGDLKKANETLHLEVIERKQAEEKITESLREKEVLLKEIHHRVKNNLQIIDSLLNLQSDKITDTGSASLLKESQNRVRSMALVHEKLYQSVSLSEILLNEYVLDLASHLFQSYGADEDKTKLKSDLESVPVNIDTAIPVGLIINELVSNSLKHAFPENSKGEISFGLRMVNGDKINLTVSDNGLGFQKEVGLSNNKSLGFELVRLLVDQLDGSIDIDGTLGTTVSILIPTFK